MDHRVFIRTSALLLSLSVSCQTSASGSEEASQQHEEIVPINLEPIAVEKVRALIDRLEIEHSYNSRCGTVVMHIAAVIEQYGDPGWELVDREFSDPSYALTLRETLRGGAK